MKHTIILTVLAITMLGMIGCKSTGPIDESHADPFAATTGDPFLESTEGEYEIGEWQPFPEVALLSIDARDIRAGELLDSICQMAWVKYLIEARGVTVASQNVPMNAVSTRSYRVGPEAIGRIPDGHSISDYFRKHDITVDGDWAGLTYSPESSRLVFTSTTSDFRNFEILLGTLLTEERPATAIGSTYETLNVVIPEFKLSNTPFVDSIRQFESALREADPAGKGVNIIWIPLGNE